MTVLYSERKPESILIRLEGIPAELKSLNRWVVWRWELRNGKWSKPPYDTRSRKYARPNDLSTWATYAEAVECMEMWKGCADEFDGLGCVIASPLVGMDIDNCRNPQTGKIECWALEIAYRIASYAEVSPSGTGIKLWAEGDLKGKGIRRKCHSGAIEIYSEDRYFTVTGDPIHCWGIEKRHAEIDALYSEFDAQADKDTKGGEKGFVCSDGHSGHLLLTQADREVISIASYSSNGHYFKMLDAGRNGEHISASEGDLAFCSMLAFFSCGNVDAMDRIFRASGRYRDKWERDDYREDTIFRAIESQNRFFSQRLIHN